MTSMFPQALGGPSSSSSSNRKKIRIAPELSDLVVYCQPVTFSQSIEECIVNFQVRDMTISRLPDSVVCGQGHLIDCKILP